MPKVRASPRGDSSVGAVTAVVSINSISVLFNLALAVKLALTPFFAYMTEPWPWTSLHLRTLEWTTFASFCNVTMDLLTGLFNNETLPPDAVCGSDRTSNAHVVRYNLVLPPNVPTTDCFGHLVRFPAALYYGRGFRRFVCSFLAANATTRASPPLTFECEHVRFGGLPLGEVCLWLLPRPTRDEFAVYYGSFTWENEVWGWVKFWFRAALTAYIVHVLWQRYYRHYIVLALNLKTVGGLDMLGGPIAKLVSPPSPAVATSSYRIVVGDPTCLVLSDPLVAFVMVVDLWVGVSYVAIAGMRVGQFTDTWLFVLGCFYASRAVWWGYLAMQGMSRLVKARRWHEWFAPVDPSVMGVLAYLYGGPTVSIMANTPLMALFHPLWDLFVPSAIEYEAVDGLGGLAGFSLLMAALPLVCSFGIAYWKRRQTRASRTRGVHPSKPLAAHSSWRNNDLKDRVLFAIAMRGVPSNVASNGGDLYTLYDADPRYRDMPLFSHRGADCYVDCLASDSTIVKQVRLSLLHCVDSRLRGSWPNDADSLLPPQSVCTLDSVSLDLLGTTSSPTALRIRHGANGCPWIM